MIKFLNKRIWVIVILVLSSIFFVSTIIFYFDSNKELNPKSDNKNYSLNNIITIEGDSILREIKSKQEATLQEKQDCYSSQNLSTKLGSEIADEKCSKITDDYEKYLKSFKYRKSAINVTVVDVTRAQKSDIKLVRLNSNMFSFPANYLGGDFYELNNKNDRYFTIYSANNDCSYYFLNSSIGCYTDDCNYILTYNIFAEEGENNYACMSAEKNLKRGDNVKLQVDGLVFSIYAKSAANFPTISDALSPRID
jgi:hypothetical protein